MILNGHYSAHEIADQLDQARKTYSDYCISLSAKKYFDPPGGKWSAAQQTRHLIIAANTGRLAYTLPKFIVWIVGGKPNRQSRSFEQLVERYNQKLQQGGKASKRFVPKPIEATYGQQKLIDQFNHSMEKFTASVKRYQDSSLDKFLAPHPLLGKITLRELGYFTVHHTYHHLQTIMRNS
jgi:hypothetical protein